MGLLGILRRRAKMAKITWLLKRWWSKQADGIDKGEQTEKLEKNAVNMQSQASLKSEALKWELFYFF